MKSQAHVVVIGGGVVGCSVLYHLAKLGMTDVVLLERTELTAGSTWHAAGGMHTLNGDPNVASLQDYTIKLYRDIERESGISCGVHETGCLYLAVSDRDIEFFQAERAKARQLGLALDFIDLADAKRLNPLLQTGDYRAAMFAPHDGHVDPSGVTQAYAQAARKLGAEIYRQTPVIGLKKLAGGEWVVETPNGAIRTQFVVNAAGLWAREIGKMMGAELPIVPMEHQYLVTNDIPELAELKREIPLCVDFDSGAYLRQERQGIVLGTYEQDCRHWALQGTPLDFGAELLPPDLERISESLQVVMNRIPVLGRTGIKRVINGGMVFSPDGNPIIGPLPGTPTGFVAAGVMAGFSQGGGVGLAVARWIIDGEPGMDVFAMDVSRFGEFATKPYVLNKTRENYQRRFVLPCPNEELDAGRPLRTTPVYDQFIAVGGVFGAVAGCEVPLWFAQSAAERSDPPSFRRTNAFTRVAEECRAVREGVGLWETSSYCKIDVTGPDAAQWLDGMVANRVPETFGRVALCPMLTSRGRILGDVTVTRLAADHCLLLGSPAAEVLYLRWLSQHAGSANIRISSSTNRLCGFSLTGPMAREVLGRVCSEDVSSSEFPFLRARRLTVGLASVLAIRVSFTGELGYELYMSPDLQRHVYETLIVAGRPFGIRNFGARALNALRIEKGYGGWGREYTQDYTPKEAGLDGLVRVDKSSFVGREAVLAHESPTSDRRLRVIAIDSNDPDPMGGETVLLNGRAIARLTSAAFGYTVGHALGLAYLPRDLSANGLDLEVQLLASRVKARVLDTAPYDPSSARLKS